MDNDIEKWKNEVEKIVNGELKEDKYKIKIICDSKEFLLKYDYDSGKYLGEGGQGEVKLVVSNNDQ